jgi:PKD repeat protein
MTGFILRRSALLFLAIGWLGACGPDPAPAPTASFTFAPEDPRAQEPITFTANVQNTNTVQWTSNPAGFSSTERNPAHTFAQPGNYQVTLTATGDGGTVTASRNVTVGEPRPTVDFGFAPAAPVARQTVTFTSTLQNATSLQWSSQPAGLTSTTANPTFAFPAAGTYQVSLQATGPGGSRTVTKSVVVAATNVAASFTVATQDPRAGEPVSFTSQSTGPVRGFQWSSDPAGFNATTQNATYVFPRAGTFGITLTVSDEFGNTAAVTRQVTVGPPRGLTPPPTEG